MQRQYNGKCSQLAKQPPEIFLRNLEQKDADEIFSVVTDPDFSFADFINSELKLLSHVVSVVKLIKKMLALSKKKKVQCLHFLNESTLIQKLIGHLEQLSVHANLKAFENFGSFADDLIEVCLFVVNDLPNVARQDDFKQLVIKISKALKTLNSMKRVNNTLVFRFIELQEKLDEVGACSTGKKKAARAKNHKQKPSGDFRRMQIYPTVQDLQRKGLDFVQPNVTKGPYKNVDHYLDVHFRLLREDFMEPLRAGLQKYRDAEGDDKLRYRYDSVRLYRKTKFEKPSFQDNGSISYVLNFDVDRCVKTNWETSRNFMHGSLLLFSHTDFRTFFCGTVEHYNLDMLQSGRLLVRLVDESDPDDSFLFNSHFAMVESDVYFDPYHLVMKVFQGLKEQSFPMMKHIVQAVPDVESPAYLRKFRDWVVFGRKCEPLDPDTWPSHRDVGLDKHQYRAMQAALIRSLCIIQGPPGTGKTYLGLKIMKVLLENMDNHDIHIQNPILVISFTNHALDQFLEGVLHFTNDVIRLGGQSRSEKLNGYNMKDVKTARRRNKKNEYFDEREDRIRRKMNSCRSKIQRQLEEIDMVNADKLRLGNPAGIFSYESLACVMTGREKTAIDNEYNLLIWLLDVEEVSHSFQAEVENDFSEMRNFTAQDEEMRATDIDKIVYAELCKPGAGDSSSVVNEQAPLEDGEEPRTELKYSITLDGLGRFCWLRQQEIIEMEANEARDEFQYHWLKQQHKMLTHKYHILKENLKKNFVDQQLYENSSKKDLLCLPLDTRWNNYWHWVELLKRKAEGRLMNLKFDHRLAAAEMEACQRENDVLVLSSASVVGMTTTYAARSRLILEKLKSSIVIVEEAAEVLEAHIVGSLTKNTEQVILIGDHKQLKPQTVVDKLAKRYHMDLSLFERLINNGMDCPILRVQHRMRPEISSLICPAIYEHLEDHYSVTKYEPVVGVGKNLFFLEHNYPETTVDDFALSWMNAYEADFVLQLCLYLVNQGYRSTDITILTTYAGQRQRLRKMQKHGSESIQKVFISVVDEYQGEENEIVILSLVRSNAEANIGFLKTENRVCVALSRAKKGFYIIGNMDILSKSSLLWRKVNAKLQQLNSIGRELMLHCQKHDIRTPVAAVKDFEAVENGGCNLMCGDVLDCTHECQYKCHAVDREHENRFSCRVECNKMLRCGHEVKLECSSDLAAYLCEEIVEFVSFQCGHILTRKCHEADLSVQCFQPCEQNLNCGHACPLLCHSGDHFGVKCPERCRRKYTDCSKEHYCQKQCFEICGSCMVMEEFVLKCNHVIKLECSTDITRFKCPVRCGKICIACQQPCGKLCWESCAPCRAEITKTIPACGHEIEVPCSVSPVQSMCPELLTVMRKAACGHDAVYGVPCSNMSSDLNLEVYLPYCEEPCGVKLNCGHFCVGSCGQCLQGRLHKGCLQVCGKELICGHRCTYPCQEVCPPCNEACIIQCDHRKNFTKCGALNIHCSAKCEWKCRHKVCTQQCGELCDREVCYKSCTVLLACGHECVGFCGEPCPQICRICNPDVISGDERYVLLVDCGCVVESHAFEEYLASLTTGKVSVHRCPACETPITKTLRFMNQVKEMYYHVAHVKKKLYGLDAQLTCMRAQVIEKLKEFYRFDEKGLPHIQKMKVYFLRTVYSKHDIVSKQDLAAIDYFAEVFNGIGRRLGSLDPEMLATPIIQKAMSLLNFILEQVNPKSLLTNMQLMTGMRCEIIRFHEILNYGLLRNETSNNKFKRMPILKELSKQMEAILYEYSRFTTAKDKKFESLFDEFLKISPSNIRWSYGNRMISSVKYVPFLGPFNTFGWFVCSRGHFYHSEDSTVETCPECKLNSFLF